RYKWYNSEVGIYISQDPIRLASGEDNLYAYVWDVNSWVDLLGLAIIPVVTKGVNGEVLTASATITRKNLGKGTNTNESSRAYARSLGHADDDAGHMIGKQLGGSGGKKNVFPQDFHVNRGEFAQFEGRVADFIDIHGSANVQLNFEYANGGTRPTKVTYTAEAPNGKKLEAKFDNFH
ncbi:MAG: DNA/RNA non-specific endonuclease, partial [Porphyromonadaceae bacterium]|nr:DNA/RNA non-specific endonuclease [Porphyromonadaceae bacterium]